MVWLVSQVLIVVGWILSLGSHAVLWLTLPALLALAVMRVDLSMWLMMAVLLPAIGVSMRTLAGILIWNGLKMTQRD